MARSRNLLLSSCHWVEDYSSSFSFSSGCCCCLFLSPRPHPPSLHCVIVDMSMLVVLSFCHSVVRRSALCLEVVDD